MSEPLNMPVPLVVLDANVLYPAVLRDVLMNLAVRDLFMPVWSEAIHDEWIRNVLEDQPHLGRERLERTKAKMLEHVPNVLTTGHEALIPNLMLPDLNDRHVLAAAIHSGAGLIVTNNLKDFPAHALEPFGVRAIAAQDYIMAFTVSHPEQVLASLRFQRHTLKSPPVSATTFLENLEKNGLRALTKWVLAQDAQV